MNKGLLCRFGWHDWAPWERYTWYGKYGRSSLGAPFPPQAEWPTISMERQKRACKACGLSQDEELDG